MSKKAFFRDKFVVFSGGKFEFRKGQDIVLRAFKVLRERHKDVLLLNAWYNPWAASMDTMAQSDLIVYRRTGGSYVANINQILVENGLDPETVITLPQVKNRGMARIYQNTDIGIFPNRCEGGTNLVLMEYMACGKPVIATDSTGHADVVTQENSILIKSRGNRVFTNGTGSFSTWPEPEMEDAIESLEWAYQNRDSLPAYGANAAAHLSKFTWRVSAEKFSRLLP